MNNVKERPVCHRAEDLVSYLYGESSTDEAHDFAQHLERCESCKAEFASFSRVHESIMLWRNEALGSVRLHTASAIASEAAASNQFEQGQRKQSARAALRQFFAMSPLWLRGATALATLLLFALALFAVSRIWMRRPQLATNNAEKVFTTAEVHEAVNKAVEEARIDALKNAQKQTTADQTIAPVPVTPLRSKITRTQVARSSRTRLSPQERQQLAADLRLIPGREDDLPFVFSDEPEQ